MVLVGIVMFAVAWPSTRAAVIKPGELSTPHAQILAGTLDSQRCGSCHDGIVAPASHDQFIGNQSIGNRAMSERCLDCHHNVMPRDTAMLAHNLSADTRRDLRLAALDKAAGGSWYDSGLDLLRPGPAVDLENVACNACHREHQGKNGDLVSMSNQQCQTCHSQQFGDFASSHPPWDAWPYGRGGSIAFDHTSHMNRHYPATPIDGAVTAFDCNACHTRTTTGELTRSGGYDQTCAACHDGALRIESSAGLELVALPSLSRAAAARIEGWPEAAIGFFDGKISGLADLLLRTDEGVSVAMRKLPRRDFALVEQGNPADVGAAVRVAAGHRELLALIAGRGQSVMADRIGKSDVSPKTLATMLSSLSPQLVDDARRRWFDGAGVDGEVRDDTFAERKATIGGDDLLGSNDLLADDLLADDDLLGDDLIGDDPLAMDAATVSPSDLTREKRFDADAMMPMGGWYRDDLTLSIRYRGGGHDDVVVRSAVELAGQLPPGDPARDRLIESKAVAACITCHPSAIDGGGWRSIPLVGVGGFTKFSHGPHLNIAGMSDCRHCHRVTEGDAVSMEFAGSMEFAPMTVSTCASCHHQKAAGDACIKCHRYHITKNSHSN